MDVCKILKIVHVFRAEEIASPPQPPWALSFTPGGKAGPSAPCDIIMPPPHSGSTRGSSEC